MTRTHQVPVIHGTVTWFPYSGLTSEEKTAARRFARDRLGDLGPSRLKCMEFGMAGLRVIGLRATGRTATGADPLTEPASDDEAVLCEACGEAAGDAAATCRICDDVFCGRCQGRHEADCDRWDLS